MQYKLFAIIYSMPTRVYLFKSIRKDKKYMVIIGSQIIHFGSKHSKTYLNHNNDIIKQNWFARHSKLNENWNDIYTAGFWSRWILWHHKTLRESIKDIEKRFNLNIIYK